MKNALKYWWLNQGERVYLPNDFSGLQFWYDVSQLEGYVQGNEVLTVTDLSGNGRHLTITAGNGGIYTENFQNGLPALLMAGTKVYTPTGAKTATDWMHQGDSTIFWVVQSSVDNATHTLFDSGPGSSASNVGRCIDFRVTAAGSNPGSFRDIARAAAGAQIFSNHLPDQNQAPKDQILLIVCRFEENKVPDAADEHSMFFNNTLMQEVNAGNATTITTSTRNPAFFGRTLDATVRFNGYFLEAFGYNRALTLEEIQQVTGGYSYGL